MPSFFPLPYLVDYTAVCFCKGFGSDVSAANTSLVLLAAVHLSIQKRGSINLRLGRLPTVDDMNPALP